MNHKTLEIGGIALVVLLILIPFGWIIIAHEPPGSFTDDVSVDMVKDVMTRAGFPLCSEKENVWDVPGALGGKTYTISQDCSPANQQPGITVHVQKFQSEETRDAMIRGFNSQVRGKPNGVLLTRGPYVILVQGHGHGEIASVIDGTLRGKT